MAINVLERMGIKDVGVTKLHDMSTDEVVLAIKQANSLELSIKSDQDDVKENGAVVTSFSKAKSADLKISTETISFAQMAMNLGAENGLELNTDVCKYDTSEEFTVTEDGTLTITLASEPVAGTALTIHQVSKNDKEYLRKLTGSADSSNKKQYTITDPKLKIGDVVEVNYIKGLEAGKAYTFTVKSKSKGVPYRLTSDIVFTNITTGELVYGLLKINKVKANENFTITMDAENHSKFDIQMTVLADMSKKDEHGNPAFFEIVLPNDEV